MELRRVVWAWETALLRLVEREPSLGRAVRRSCRPIAAERRADGRLTLAIASWWPPDLHELRVPASISRLDSALSEFLFERLDRTLDTFLAAARQARDTSASTTHTRT